MDQLKSQPPRTRKRRRGRGKRQANDLQQRKARSLDATGDSSDFTGSPIRSPGPARDVPVGYPSPVRQNTRISDTPRGEARLRPVARSKGWREKACEAAIQAPWSLIAELIASGSAVAASTLSSATLANYANYLVGPATLVSGQRSLAEGGGRHFAGQVGAMATAINGASAAESIFWRGNPAYFTRVGALSATVGTIPDIVAMVRAPRAQRIHGALLGLRTLANWFSSYYAYWAAQESEGGHDDAADLYGKLSSGAFLTASLLGVGAEVAGRLTPSTGPDAPMRDEPNAVSRL